MVCISIIGAITEEDLWCSHGR